jgi:hypothetical protein
MKAEWLWFTGVVARTTFSPFLEHFTSMYDLYLKLFSKISICPRLTAKCAKNAKNWFLKIIALRGLCGESK